MIKNSERTDESRVIHFQSMTRISFIKHLFTTRSNDMGKKGFSVLRTPSETAEKIRRDLGLEHYTIAFSRQAHTDRVKVLKTIDDVNALNNSNENVDGLVTNLKGIALFTVYADCTPIYIVDEVRQVIGLAHSGWRGTLLNIGPKMLQIMIDCYGCDLKDIRIGIGPSISQKHFEVGNEVSKQFVEAFGQIEGMVDYSGLKPHVDVRVAIALSFQKLGLKPEQIESSSHCTFEESETFYSYRREGQAAGRMAAVLAIKA